jgi:hypothetical protein
MLRCFKVNGCQSTVHRRVVMQINLIFDELAHNNSAVDSRPSTVEPI